MAELNWTHQKKDFGAVAFVEDGFYWIKESGGLFSFVKWVAGFEAYSGNAHCITIGKFPDRDDAVRACQDRYDLEGYVMPRGAAPVDDELLKWSTLDKHTWFSNRGEYRLIRGTNVECFNVYVKNERTLFNLIASPKTLHDAKQAAQYHYDALRGNSEPEPAAPVEGLVTVAKYEHMPLRAQLVGDTLYEQGRDEELVTRSQADELLAAERAETMRQVKHWSELYKQQHYRAEKAEALIAAKVERERLRFEGDLDKWMKTIGAGITGYQPEAYALMDLACQELVKLRADNAALTAEIESWKKAFAAQSTKLQAVFDECGDQARKAAQAVVKNGDANGST